MQDDLEKKSDATNLAGTIPAKASASSDRVKRMRGWLGVKSSVETRNFGGGGDILVDVDAPNGWNR